MRHNRKENNKKERRDQKVANREREEDSNRNDRGKEQDYMTYGMSLGMLAGSIGMMLCTLFGAMEWGAICISIGMLFGMAIGKSVKKK